MARKYGHIQSYEKEIKEMPENDMTQREIGGTPGFSKEQVSGFVKRLHAKERKVTAGEALRKKGRPQRVTNTQKQTRLVN